MARATVYGGQSPQSLGIPESGATLTNYGPGTVYYASSRNVSDTQSDGSVAAGSSVTLYGSTYVYVTRADARADVDVASLSVVEGISGTLVTGADTSGTIDATAAFQAAYATAASVGHYTVVVPPGTYTVSGRIHGAAATSSPVRLVAAIPGTVTIQRSTAQCVVEVVGNRSGTVALSADVAQGATSLTVASLPAGGLNVDDHIEVYSNVLFATGSGSSAATVAEVAKVKTIAGTGPYTITLYGPLEEAYATANSSTIARLDLAGSDSLLSGIVFRQTAQNRDDAGYPLVRFNLARRIRIDRCTGRDADVPGFELRGVIDADLTDCLVENLTDNVGSNYIGYGINLAGNSRDIRIERLRAKWVRHAFTTTYGAAPTGPADVGVPRHVTISDGQCNGTNGGGWNTHKEGKYITFANCESHNDKSYGFYIRSPHTTIINPTVSVPGAGTTLAGIKVAENESPDCLITGGRIVLGPNSFSGIQTESPRTTVHGTEVLGPGGAGSNFRVEAAGTESAFLDVRSKDPFASAHIAYAAAGGGGHVIHGGVFSSSAGKQLVSSGGGTTAISVTGAPRGTNLTSYGNQVNLSADNVAGYVSKSSNYTLSDLDGTVGFDTTAAGRTATLPDATKCVGRTFVIKNAAGANSVTLATTASQTIDGGAPATTLTANQVARFQSTGTNWITV